MSWSDLITGLNRACMGTFNEKEGVLFIRKDGSTQNVDAIFDNNFTSVDPDTGASITTTTPVISVIASDLLLPPDEEDKVVVRGREYKITEPQPDSEGMIKLVLHRVTNV